MKPEQLYYEDIRIGDDLHPLVEYPTTMQLVKFAAASNDYYQVHYDRGFAEDNGLKDVIVQGWLVLSFIGRMVTGWMGESGKLVQLGGEYRQIMYVNEELFCYGRVAGKRQESGKNLVELDAWVENLDGIKTLTGSATVELPGNYSDT